MQGKPLEVYVKESTDANKLIEEFMLFVIRRSLSISKYWGSEQRATTFVYRVHDQPGAG